jgi:hypothetical protein
MRSTGRAVTLVVIGTLMLAAAAIHFYVGGILLLLNAAGAVGLLVGFAITHVVLREARPLALMAIIGFTATSIVGWAIIGPYFDLAYLTKGIEAAVIAVAGVALWQSRTDIGPAFRWLRALPMMIVGIARAPSTRVSTDAR